MLNLTAESLKLFTDLANDAGNWNGTPLLTITKEQRGNLTQLKREGLVETFKDEGCDWVDFTPKGKEEAAKLGIQV